MRHRSNLTTDTAKGVGSTVKDQNEVNANVTLLWRVGLQDTLTQYQRDPFTRYNDSSSPVYFLQLREHGRIPLFASSMYRCRP
jgi:hypothetical protein